MCADMHRDMRMEMRIDMCTFMHMEMCLDIRIDMRIFMRIGMCTFMCIDGRIGMRIGMRTFMHANRHAYRRVCRCRSGLHTDLGWAHRHVHIVIDIKSICMKCVRTCS